MGLSKSQSILILLTIDVAFFLLEITVGYAVHSLALVADSFHMLNDVISLLVGLWAVKVAQQKERTSMYTYGWQRAETVGALVNGVFLVALCLSIVLDAIQRFVEPQEVSSPKLVLIVGCCGLASNILGLALFHDHGHGHGHGGHSHGPGDAHSAAEEGHSHAGHDHEHAHAHKVAAEAGKPVDVLPTHMVDSAIGPFPADGNRNQPEAEKYSSPRRTKNGRGHSRSRSRAYSNIDEIHVHPASFRNEIITAGRAREEDSELTDSDENGDLETPSEQTPLMYKTKANGGESSKSKKAGKKSHGAVHDLHQDHKHRKPKDASHSGHGHSHGDLNMRGVFLHVLGDALGNIGVILSALFIWLTDFWWRFYTDPAISLIITLIILTTAIPLCKAASRILLQAVPHGISIDDLKEDIEGLPGIISAHHIHVWQLSDTKSVASLHVQVEFDFKGQGSARYMELARAIRMCLHEYGIHSSTIQPEFSLDTAGRQGNGADGYGSADDSDATPAHGRISKKASQASSLAGDACLLECGDECGDSKQCCAPTSATRDNSDNGK